jgi:hypothetical protein
MNLKIALLSVLTLVLVAPLVAQDDTKPWERLGLSLTEWKLIQDNKMPMSKLESLLKDGIGISEYFTKPWEPLGMTEAKWIAKRRTGLTSYDIEQQSRAAEKDTAMQPTPVTLNTFKEPDRSRETREQFASLFLPGFMQCKVDHKVRGRIMIALAVGSIAGCTAWSIAGDGFMPVPVIAVLVPVMGWSFIDHKLYLNSLRQ